jgi:hypothetical protein
MQHAASVIALMSNVVGMSSCVQMFSEPQAAGRIARAQEELTRY